MHALQLRGGDEAHLDGRGVECMPQRLQPGGGDEDEDEDVQHRRGGEIQGREGGTAVSGGAR